MKKILLTLFIMLFLVNVAYANRNCFQFGCSDQNLDGGRGFTVSGSNLQGKNNFPEYERCNIIATGTSMLAFDFDLNTQFEIITVSDTNIRAYSTNCEIMHSQSITSKPEGSAIVTNIDTDAWQEIAYVNTTHALFWEWNNITGEFDLIKLITVGASVMSLGCSRSQVDTCIAMKQNSDDVFVIDIDAETVVELTAEMPGNSLIDWDNIQAQQGLGIGRELNTLDFRYSMPRISTNDLYFDTVDIDGNFIESTPDLSSASGAIAARQDYFSAMYGKMGTNFYLFVHASYYKTNIEQVTAIFDIDMNVKLRPCDGDYFCVLPKNYTSNWAVADYNKDGINDACLLITNSTTDAVTFQCYDENFNTPIANFACDVEQASSGLYMADFFPNNATMGIATATGIYTTEGDSCTIKGNSTATYDTVGWQNASAIGFANGASRMPVYVFNDGVTAFVMRDTNSTFSCGNGICEDFENDFTCSIDCAISGAVECEVDGDCVTAYPYCISNLCVASDNISVTCTLDTDCPYDNPFCHGGICIKGWMSGQPATKATAAQQQVDDSFNDTVGLLFGTSVLLKFLIALGLIIGTIVAVAQYTKNGLAIAISGLMMMIFTTVSGLMPIYVLILIVISGIGILALGKFFMPSAGGG